MRRMSADEAGVGKSAPLVELLFVLATFPLKYLAYLLEPGHLLTGITELAFLAIFVVLLWLAATHRDKVLYLLTGDPILHFDPLEVASGLLHCCCGSGEATRWVTGLSCCRRCPSLYRQNLVVVLGQALGIRAYSLTVSDIVVGDLPGRGRGSFYCSIECRTDPAMVTSVAEQKLHKVVHFPESFIVRIRPTALEWRLRVSVRRLTAVGHDELCEAYFSAPTIMEFCEQPMVRRFQMRPVGDRDVEVSPWISLLFRCPGYHEQPPDDVLHTLETLPNEEVSMYCCVGQPIVLQGLDGEAEPMEAFKARLPLMDSEGHPAHELPESYVRELQRSKVVSSLAGACFQMTGVTGLVLYSVGRSYVRSCREVYTVYAKAVLVNRTWGNISLPFRHWELKAVEEACQDPGQLPRLRLRNTPRDDWLLEGHSASPCRPTLAELGRVCARSTLRPPPKAFGRGLRGQLLETGWGPPCQACVCMPTDGALDLCDRWVPLVFFTAFMLGAFLRCTAEMRCWRKWLGSSDPPRYHALPTGDMQLGAAGPRSRGRLR